MTNITEDFSAFTRFFVALSLADFIHYASAAGALWLFFYVIRRRHWLGRKVVSGFAPWKDVRREIVLSALTCVIYSAMVFLTFLAIRRGWTQVYFDLHEFGWGWFAASIVLTVFVHDAYFYWTHRLMHLRFLYPIMHRMHHRSTNPTPWAAYAFDPLEAVLAGGNSAVGCVPLPDSPARVCFVHGRAGRFQCGWPCRVRDFPALVS